VIKLSDTALIVFVKNATLGRVKTRLAKDIGDEEALEVYNKLLMYTKNLTSELDCQKYIYYSDSIIENDIWENGSYNKKLQKGLDLGERICDAFEAVLTEHDAAIIIGSDCPTLTSKHINLAISSLQETDYVIGPSEDGGYYLLGMKKLIDDFFNNIAWSTSNVFSQTFNKIIKSGLTVTEIDILTDIDYVQDLERFAHRLTGH